MKIAITAFGPMLPCAPGTASLESFSLASLEAREGGDWFDADAQLGPKGYKYLGQAARYLFASARQLESRTPEGPSGHAGSEGVLIGSNTCARRAQDEFDAALMGEGYLGINPMRAPEFCSNMGAGNLSIRYKAKAFNITLMTPVTAGLDAVILAARSLAAGRADSAIAGAMEDDCRIAYAGGYAVPIRGGAWTVRLRAIGEGGAEGPRALALVGPACNGFLPSRASGGDAQADVRLQAKLDPLFAGGPAEASIASLGDAGSLALRERLLGLLAQRGIAPSSVRRNAGETGYATLQALAHLTWMGRNAAAAVCFAIGPSGHVSALRITREG